MSLVDSDQSSSSEGDSTESTDQEGEGEVAWSSRVEGDGGGDGGEDDVQLPLFDMEASGEHPRHLLNDSGFSGSSPAVLKSRRYQEEGHHSLALAGDQGN